MATRSVLFVSRYPLGVYCHWNGHPGDRVPELVDAFKQVNGDLASFYKTYIGQATFGWAVFPSRQFPGGETMNDCAKGKFEGRAEYEYTVYANCIRVKTSGGELRRLSWDGIREGKYDLDSLFDWALTSS